MIPVGPMIASEMMAAPRPERADAASQEAGTWRALGLSATSRE